MKREKYEPFFNWRAAILNSGMPPTTRHVLLTLACHMNDAGESCYPTIATLCRETGLSNRTIITHLDIACSVGWIKVGKHGFSGQKWSRNDYQIAWPNADEGSEGGSPPSPKGSEPDDRKVVKEVHRLHQKAVNLTTEGSEPSDQKAVKEVHTSTPVNSSRVLHPRAPQSTDPFDTTPPFITLTLNTGAEHPIHETQIAEWGTLFPAVDARQELRAIRAWLLANPKRRKTRNGILRFVTSWLSRTQDRGGSNHAPRQPPPGKRTFHTGPVSDAETMALARQKGIEARVGESMEAFRLRLIRESGSRPSG